MTHQNFTTLLELILGVAEKELVRKAPSHSLTPLTDDGTTLVKFSDNYLRKHAKTLSIKKRSLRVLFLR